MLDGRVEDDIILVQRAYAIDNVSWMRGFSKSFFLHVRDFILRVACPPPF